MSKSKLVVVLNIFELPNLSLFRTSDLFSISDLEFRIFQGKHK
jgi:hypothetical protein